MERISNGHRAGADITEPPLPDWLVELRPHQRDALDEIEDRFKQGARVVLLDAPTGSGKTLIAEVTRRRLHAKGLYICTTKTLQDQFLRDFPYARVLKGRSNYTPQYARGDKAITCDDCTSPTLDEDERCMWCEWKQDCPYNVAKREALQSKLAVVNTAYFLNEANAPHSSFAGRDLVVADECDELERALMGFAEFRALERECDLIGLAVPKKGSRKRTIGLWLTDEYMPAMWRLAQELRDADPKDTLAQRRRKRLVRTFNDAAFVAEELLDGEGADTRDDDEKAGASWIRDNDSGALVMRPVKVDRYGESLLWRHGKRWLCMSATIISPDEMADSLGIDGFEVVEVPMTFPVENRPIYAAPVARVVRAEMDVAVERLAIAIHNICAMPKYRNHRVLVHTVSYQLTRALKDRLFNLKGREVFAYLKAEDRDWAMRQYTARPNAVLLAPSMDRGYDFRDDLARVVIVAKVPFPYLGDKMVAARMHAPGGQWWYAVQTVRTLVQMTGRGVRSAEDWADTWILDREFTSNVWAKNRALFPKWWRDAVSTEVDMRQIVKAA